jgi:hypothetical protein
MLLTIDRPWSDLISSIDAVFVRSCVQSAIPEWNRQGEIL